MKAPFTHIATTLLSGLLAGLMAIAITACGGGGSSSSVTAPPVDKTPVPPGTAPSITTQPVKLSVVAGKTATFSVVATGSATLAYQWKKNGADISGATSSTYAIPATTPADSGDYSVVVTNSAGTVTSAAASLTVTAQAVAPSITGQPFAKTVTAGQTATFTVEATGTSPLRYQWKKNGTNIPDATTSSYTTPATLLIDNGVEYLVEVSNEAGTASSSVGILTVTTKPAITTQPAAQTVISGQTAKFTVEAAGTPTLRYQWKKGGTNIEGATGSSYTTPATELANSGAEYSVEVSNDVGTVTSEVVILTVTMGPVIAKEPAALTVNPGDKATFSVEATGTPDPTYQWQKNGVNVTAGEGATSNTYTTPATTIADDGAKFSVVVSNSAGKTTSKEAILSVNAPASIDTQPANKAVVAGQTASFSVTAAGTGPFTYQWKRGGVDVTTGVGGTTSTYTTPATVVATDHNAVFTVEVRNSAGTVTSSSATLSVFATRYSEVPKPSGTYLRTECVKDNITGLVWEGKNPAGSTSRLGTAYYTNYDSTSIAQKPSGNAYVNPTQTDIDASSNSIGYKTSVNAGSGLCGFTDWRMPTKDELLGIVVDGQDPKIDSTWFPNTRSDSYWTSTRVDNAVWTVQFYGATPAPSALISLHNGTLYVRLVRCGAVSPATCTSN